ncbi:FkbM family methyltransferase [Streptomyces sp. 2112.3]|uniref:FkbM family methyltransferase n=1 Tax=Streptomyces sp. 2112.3 TaxID=1881023 RepID=UPI000B87BF50|nr:FkbM family methyltransferase [Streptomyces sp. 2112.3]
MTNSATMPGKTAPNSVAQALLKCATAAHNGSIGRRIIRSFARFTRRFWAEHGDPLVTCRIAGQDIVMPLSHDLPVILSAAPHYSQNLARLTAMSAAARPDLTIVDIGANIGDTAVLMRAAATAPILCVEGDDLFLDLLRRNVERLRDVEIEEAYVATADDTDRARTVVRQAGTAALVPPTSGPKPARPFRSLPAVLGSHARFSSPGLVKIDTDGADPRIIVANRELLARARPVVFFEFAPLWAAGTGDENPYRAVTALAEAGYQGALVYANTGELLLVTRVTEPHVWKDLGRYTLVHGNGSYYDVAAFHADDADLFEQAGAAERAFFDGMAAASR